MKAIENEQRAIRKAYSASQKTLRNEERKRQKQYGFISDHPWWYESSLIDAMNESGLCDTHFETVYVPLYVYGPNYRKRRYESIKSNPSTGYFGVQVSRPTFEAGVIGPEGRPMPKSLTLEKEFPEAIARGRRADPDEKGFKLYLPQYKILQKQGYPFVLGLPMSLHTDFADLYGGPGAKGIAMLGSSEGNIRSTTEQFNLHYREFNPQQSANDMSVYYASSMEMPAKEDPESATAPPTLYDTGRMKGELVKDMESALKEAPLPAIKPKSWHTYAPCMKTLE